jgi:PAS domain S-box-containing protein
MIEMVSKRTYNLDGFDVSAACALAIVATALDGIITIADNGIIQTVNHATESIFGYTDDELIGNNVKILMPEPYHGNHDKYLANYRGTGIKRIIGIGREVVGKRKDGSLFPLDLAITEARVDGQVLFVGTVRDISERKAIETEIRTLNEDLEARVNDRTAELSASNAELDAFAYSVSHDLRAPLRHIDGFIDLLRGNIEPQLDPKSKHYLDTITDSARRMGVLIDNLLAFSRMARIELSKHDVNLNAVVEDVIEQLQPESDSRSIEWRVGHLEAAKGDQALLTMVWTNLIQNAFKFTRDKLPAVIEIGYTSQNSDNNIYFIRDNGVGFDEKYAANLFGVFQRLHRQEEFEGTGIGLATVRRIVQRHGGSIRAEAELGKGATFYISLPKGGG